MKRDVEVLNKIYRIVDIGIIAIEEVIKKVKDNCLEKLMLDEKKEYYVIRADVKHLLDEYEEEPKHIGTIARISNDIYTNMKLLVNENDKEIAKMMLEGTNHSIIDVTKMLNEKDYQNDKITEILERLKEVLEHNEIELKKYL